MKKIRSLLVAGAASYDCFYQHLRLLDGAFKLSAKDLRSQVVREACITVAWVSFTDMARCPCFLVLDTLFFPGITLDWTICNVYFLFLNILQKVPGVTAML